MRCLLRFFSSLYIAYPGENCEVAEFGGCVHVATFWEPMQRFREFYILLHVKNIKKEPCLSFSFPLFFGVKVIFLFFVTPHGALAFKAGKDRGLNKR